MISAILFDKDGTLFDFYRTWAQAIEGAALLAAEGDSNLANSLMNHSGRDFATGLYAPGSVIASGSNSQIVDHWSMLLGRSDIEPLYRKISDLFLSHDDTKGVPVVELDRFFQSLKERGYRLGIATMDSEQSARQSMAHHGADLHLDFICGYDSGHGVKPAPGMVHGFTHFLGISGDAQSVMVVGDSPHDIHMAKNAGAGRAIGVLTGVSPRETLFDAGADEVITSIAELDTVL